MQMQNNLITQTNAKLQNNKRLSVAGDKLINMNLNSNYGTFTNLDDESNYLKKLEITENNVVDILEHRKNVLQFENENKEKFHKSNLENIEAVNKENLELRKKLFELENQFDHLNIEFNKCNEMKQKYHSDIIKIRKDNTKDFDAKLNVLKQQDKRIKTLKKELFLIINLLKMRIVNLDSLEEDQMIKGYIINIEKNTIKYIQFNKNEEAIKKCADFWNAMKELLMKEEKVFSKEMDNKDNTGISSEY
jgi:hypothetical protein